MVQAHVPRLDAMVRRWLHFWFEPATPTNLAQAIAKLLASGNLTISLAVLSETGSSFVPIASGA